MRKLAIATLVCLTLPAQASFFLNPYYSSSDTNFKNGQDVKTTTYGLEGGNDTFTLGFSNRNYSFQHSKNIDNLKSLYGNIHHGDALGDDGWSYFLYLGASLNWEDDFHPSENYNINPNAALTYHYDDELSLTLGAGGVINEYNSLAYPIVQVNFSNPKSDGLSFLYTDINPSKATLDAATVKRYLPAAIFTDVVSYTAGAIWLAMNLFHMS